MYCTRCGNSIITGNKYCNTCGAPVRQAVFVQASVPSTPLHTKLQVLFKPLLTFVVKHKWYVLLSVAVLIGALIVYKVFFEPRPADDAQLIAKEQCECETVYHAGVIEAYRLFTSGFTKASYTSRGAARDYLSNLQQGISDKLNNCNTAVNDHMNQLRNRYAKSNKKLAVFDNALAANETNHCVDKTATELIELQAKAEQLISTITEPEPDENTIKAKLIGTQLPGWNVASLSEFESLVIKSKNRAGNQLEYTVDFTVANANRKSVYTYSNTIIQFYMGGDGNWYLQKALAREYQWSTTVTNTWYRLQIPPGVTYRIDSHGEKGWVKDDSWFARQYRIGPDGDQLSLNTSTIFIASRENHEIVITLNITAN